jgi:F-type H+-transporting ATPase subunit gamma
MMASLKDIQRKIKSVKGTQKTTRAMKLVSSAKLRRAEQIAKNSKEYAVKITDMMEEISANLAKANEEIDNPFFKVVKSPKVVDIVIVTSDKGLCGGFNSQTIKKVDAFIKEFENSGAKVRLRAIGKKAISYYKFQNRELLDEIDNLSSAPNYEKASEFIKGVVESYLNGETDKVVIVHNGYVNMITQEIRVDNILPLDPSEFTPKAVSTSELEVEPDDDSLLEALINRYIEYTMYYALIDSLAAEHGARMQAMDAATNNSKEMVKSLTVSYNKARQEAITTELIEIISGVESMK